MLRRLCVVSSCCVPFVVIPGIALGQEAPPQPAAIEVADRLPVDLTPAETDGKTEGWLKVPEYLGGAKIHVKPAGPLSTLTKRRFACSVKERGVLLLAATWDEPPNAGGSWRNTHWKPKKLLEEGWTPIDTMQQRTADNTLGYTIFRRIAEAGETYEFHTNPVHSPLAIVLDPAQAAAALARPAIVAASNPIVALDPPDEPATRAAAGVLLLGAHEHRGFAETMNWTDMFSREVARQAFLVAAREELGLATRDAMLREEFPTEGGTGPAARSVMVIKRHLGSTCETTVTLFHRDGDRYVADWEGEFRNTTYRVVHHIATDAEKLSRTEFPALLRSMGYEGEALAFRERAPVPAETERKLAHFSMMSQFGAVRDLHALARKEGSSPEILAGLSRGYANLSVLTDHLWSPAHNVFKARALLYAERRVALGGDDPTPEALMTRGYARALAGMHARSEDDFKEAGAKLAAIDKSQKLPDWADLMWAFVKYDNEKLRAAEDAGGQRSLARMLRLLTLYGTAQEQPLAIVKAATRMIEIVPDCDRASAALNEINLWEVRGPVVQERGRYFSRTLYPSLTEITGLPADVGRFAAMADEEDVARESQRRRELIDALKRSGRLAADRQEPSLDCLGQLVREVSFVHAADLLWYRFRWQGRDPRGDFETLRPAIEQHPYFPYARMLSVDEEQRRKIVGEFAPTLDDPAAIAQIEESARDMLYVFHMTDPSAEYWKRLAHPASRHRSRDVFRELMMMYEQSKDEGWRNRMMQDDLPLVSPHMPFAAAYRVAHNWRAMQSRLAEIEKRYGDDSLVLLRLGEQYVAHDRLEEAERVLARCVELQTTWKGYEPLAGVYWRKQEHDRWRATLDEFIRFRFGGLERELARVKVAKYLLLQGKRDEALAYADAAAESYANWALLFAALCHEEVGEWDKAEGYLRAAAGQYGHSSLHWLAWCRRTGRGDEKAARELARKYLESLGELPPDQLQQVAEYYLYADEPENALQILEHAYDKTKRPYEGVLLAIVADDLERNDLRDESLRRVAESTDPPEEMKLYVDLAELLRKSLAAEGKPQLDPKAVDALAGRGKTSQPTFVWYAAGRFLANRSDRAEADRYLKLAAGSPRWLDLSAILSWQALRERNVEIDKRRFVEIPGRAPPEPKGMYSQE